MSYKYRLNFLSPTYSTPLNDLELVQLGRIYCDETTVFENHYHKNWYEFTFVTDGKGTIYTNNTPIEVKKGDIYLSYVYDIHKIKSDKTSPLKYDYFAFFPTNSELAERLHNITMNFPSAKDRLFKDDRLFPLISSAIKEIDNINNPLTLSLLNSIFMQVLIYSVKDFEDNKVSSTSLTKNNILCTQIMDYISLNLYNIDSLTELSKIFSYSYNYLSYVFKKTTFLTLMDYYNMIRLEEAKNLIKKEKLNVKEVAERLNYSTPYSFSKAFKNRYKISPMQYKKVHQ
ncbi:MAG: helix-turn-helix transcriptional regulator [Clostridia bacterium]|nr:helix-turn-helix transcriptional regulator [Clostridia bacterium]